MYKELYVLPYFLSSFFKFIFSMQIGKRYFHSSFSVYLSIQGYVFIECIY